MLIWQFRKRIYGDKQQLILESDNSIILDCYMNEFDAITLALSYGENAKVIYPDELVCKMKNIKITNMLKQY
ncbi:MAG: WYL domain-containing protein [Clostridium sp.]|nr:MAG: WYL domain-containing protein [Clostridium sp.]